MMSSAIKKNFFSFFRKCIQVTKNSFSERIYKLFHKDAINDSFFKKLEKIFLESDVSIKTTERIISHFRNEVYAQKITESNLAMLLLKKNLLKIVRKSEKIFSIQKSTNALEVILFVGVNGVGKTSNMVKLAYRYKNLGKRVLLSAGDTFRAAAIEQLKKLGETHKISVFSKNIGEDPASVIFESISIAKSNQIDILMIDTSGRLHNKTHLMKELQKIDRVIKTRVLNTSYTKILVLDAGIGQNSMRQVSFFHKIIQISGIIITKLDSNAKGGVIFSIAEKLSIPIFFLSSGDKIVDLEDFNSDSFINSLF